MKVILVQDVKGTGKAGEVVEVSDGFARNRLIPKGMAKEATPGNMKNLKKQQEIKTEKNAEAIANAEEMAKKLESTIVVLKSKGGEGGKLFGSITSKDISDALKEQQGMDVDKKKIQMESPIKTAGEHEVKAKLYGGVNGIVKVRVDIED